MKKIVVTVLFSLISLSSFANNFAFNYKNLNSLSSLICNNQALKVDKSNIVINKFTTHKSKYGPQSKQVKYVLSGTCNAILDSKSKEVLSFGEELQLTIDLTQKAIIQGKVGMNNITVHFHADKLQKIVLQNIYDNQKSEMIFNNTKWAKTDSLFSFNESDLIEISQNNRIIASEKESTLFLRNGLKTYNIWNHQAYSCYGKNLNQEKCELLSESI